MAALEQLRALYAAWVSGAVALAQQLPGAIAASAAQQAPAAQVRGSTQLLHVVSRTCSLPAGPWCCPLRKQPKKRWHSFAAGSTWPHGRRGWRGAAAQASGLVRLAAAVLALGRPCDSGGGDSGAAEGDGELAQHAMLAQLAELGPQLAAAQYQVMLCRIISSCRLASDNRSAVCRAAGC